MKYEQEMIDAITKALEEASGIVSALSAALAGAEMEVTVWNTTPLGRLQRIIGDAIERLTEEGEEDE